MKQEKSQPNIARIKGLLTLKKGLNQKKYVSFINKKKKKTSNFLNESLICFLIKKIKKLTLCIGQFLFCHSNISFVHVISILQIVYKKYKIKLKYFLFVIFYSRL